MIKCLLLFLFEAIIHLHYSSCTGFINKQTKKWYPDNTQSTFFFEVLMTGNECKCLIVFKWHMSTRAVLFTHQIKVFFFCFSHWQHQMGIDFIEDRKLCCCCARSIIKVFALLYVYRSNLIGISACKRFESTV